MMLQRWLSARLLWPSVATLFGLAVLVGLGTWQLQRKAWKEDIVAKIAARVQAPPVAFSGLQARISERADLEYTHVAVTGRFHHDKERYLYAPASSGLAWQVLTPLEWRPGQIVWINRGRVPDARRQPAARAEGQVAGQVTITGLLRRPHAGAFTPANDVARNIWHVADIAQLTRSAFPEQMAAAPLVVEADGPAPGGLPAGGVTRLAIPNRHLEYALTWYGLALTLVGVFAAFARSRLKPTSPPVTIR